MYILLFADLNISKNVRADSFVCVQLTVLWRHRLAQLLLWTWARLKIGCWCWWSLSLGWISLTAAPTSPEKRTHTHASIRWTHQVCTHCVRPAPQYDPLVLSLSNRWRGFPGYHLCRWPLFRGSIQDPRRAGWQHARSTSELSYHWHQVSRTCHVFILWEFNPPFRMDQALCRWREADKCCGSYSASSGECITPGMQACLIKATLLVMVKQ